MLRLGWNHDFGRSIAAPSFLTGSIALWKEKDWTIYDFLATSDGGVIQYCV
jgi:hypothetical protein